MGPNEGRRYVISTLLKRSSGGAHHKIKSLGSLLLSAGAITAVNALLHFALRASYAGHMMPAGPTRWI